MTESPYDDIGTAPDIVELTTLDEFERWRRAPHGCIVIKDSTSGTPIAHHRDVAVLRFHRFDPRRLRAPTHLCTSVGPS